MLSAHAPRRFASAKPAPTLRLVIARSFLLAFVAVATVGGAVAAAHVTGQAADGLRGSDVATDVAVAPETTEAADPAADHAAALIARHDCRVEGYGPTVIPGHAVVATPGHGPRYVSSDPAFRIVFGADGTMGTGDEPAGTVYAFCR